MQRLADRIYQYVTTRIRAKSTVTREQPPRMCKNCNSKMGKNDSAIGHNLIKCLECAKTYADDNVHIIRQARSSFYLNVLESVYITVPSTGIRFQKITFSF